MKNLMTQLLAFSLLSMTVSSIFAFDLQNTSARQLLVVVTADESANQGHMYAFSREGDHWQAQQTNIPVTIGREGLAWGIGLHPEMDGPQKREGDGKSPSGVFELGIAFGYADDVITGLQYQAMSERHFCVDVTAAPLYNQIVDTGEVGEAAVKGSTEPMRRDIHADGDHRYKMGFMVNHNPDNVPGAGSCIFFHLWKAPGVPTVGCTAFPEEVMDRVLAWLDQSQQPLLVSLTIADYERLADQWSLPAL